MTTTMQLQVTTPGAIVVDETIVKVKAEATTGAFTLLPRHLDLVAILVPGLVDYVGADTSGNPGEERLLAVASGVLVKKGPLVRIATSEVAEGASVLGLQRALRSSYEDLAESERRSRAALAHLETDAIRRLIALGDHA